MASLSESLSLSQSDLISGTFETPTAAYVHIPFCRRRCYYCDFPISVVGDRPPLSRQPNGRTQEFGTIAEYVEQLRSEIQATVALAYPRPLDTIFFGGGTPSLLSPQQLETLLDALNLKFGIAPGAEISIEIDPGTFDLAHLQGYRTAGVNRVSLGVQAFQPELLAACGRTHTPADIEAAVELIHRVELSNFSLDLISGLPHQTLDQWQDSLEKAIAYAPSHLSVYDLTVEPGTAFARWYQPGMSPLPSDDQTAEMYRSTQRTLTRAGYDHYEISNYARSGYQCRHNRVYWENRPYYGFGMGAASYTQGQRFIRPRKRREYYDWVCTLQQRQGAIDAPMASEEDRLLDTLMLGLRLAEGLNLNTLVDQFGAETVRTLLSCVRPYQQQGWVEVQDEQGQPMGLVQEQAWLLGDRMLGDRIRLTDPEGFLFSNVVLTTLFQTFQSEESA